MQRKNESSSRRFCPKCGSPKIKRWDELTEDEKFMVERLPGAGEFSSEERRRHRFCARCFFEDKETDAETV
ncbi:hypothetical protein BH20ACI4_BH20ACI4_23050 [soil metagenome]